MTPPPLPEVAGFSLDGPHPYVISREENRALCATMDRLPATDGSAHPIFYHVATQVGMRVTIGGLCEACGFDIADGPMLGASKVAFAGPLMTDQAYRVRGQIVRITRKASSRFGIIDLVDYELSLLLPDDTTVVSVVQTLVLPRGRVE